jgi:cytochrome c
MGRSAIVMVLGSAMAAPAALAQFNVPVSKPSPESLFRNQCAACHTLDAAEPPRQGPTLAGIVGRRAGSVAGFHYSPGFAGADFVWDTAHLDSWLANPQAMIPGAVMPYRQANPDTRHAIIAYLEQH